MKFIIEGEVWLHIVSAHTRDVFFQPIMYDMYVCNIYEPLLLQLSILLIL